MLLFLKVEVAIRISKMQHGKIPNMWSSDCPCPVHACAQPCPTLCEPMDCAHQPPLSVGFPRQESWTALPFPSPGDLPDPGMKPLSPPLAGGFFTTEPPEKPIDVSMSSIIY